MDMSAESQIGEPSMELSTVYVTVEDMDRALAFYRELFGVDPAQVDERFSTFAFDGVDFGLYHAGSDGHEADFGDNCVPNFEVDDAAAARERLADGPAEVLHDGLVEIDDYRCFHARDTEGNRIEVFSVGD